MCNLFEQNHAVPDAWVKEAEALQSDLFRLIEVGKSTSQIPEDRKKLTQVAVIYQRLSQALRKISKD